MVCANPFGELVSLVNLSVRPVRRTQVIEERVIVAPHALQVVLSSTTTLPVRIFPPIEDTIDPWVTAVSAALFSTRRFHVQEAA